MSNTTIKIKYKTINGFTKQSMIYLINKRMLSVRSMMPTAPGTRLDVNYTQCAYSGENGNHCAVGVFIPPNLYNERMEGLNVNYLLLTYDSLYDYMPLESTGLIEMQGVHDATHHGDVREALIVWILANVEDGDE